VSVAIVTGSSGLVGSESVRFLHEKGLDVHGVDNDLRGRFFGAESSVAWMTERLVRSLPRFTHHALDVRDASAVSALFARLGSAIRIVVHAAAQPSHDWAAREPETDFTVNANATLGLLEATRRHCPEASFVFLSTNKVYGDTPNRLPRVEHATRFELDPAHPFATHGIDETMSVDASTHSLFGVSKLAADLLTQEYGRYFGLRTACFRCGCLTGPAHSGAELHGFLAWLVRCAVTGRPYTVIGYGGKQVRDNLDSRDLVEAFWRFHEAPRSGAVYNMGGARYSHCSMLEAIALVQELAGRELALERLDEARVGDHAWWISDVRRFQSDYPGWAPRRDLRGILREMVEAARERQRGGAAPP
jgi:CDP-paratose 2-epimerase